jgi:uncharacterized protein
MLRLLPFLLFTPTLAAQLPPDVAMERSGFIAWLKTAPNSPLAAIARRPVGDGLRLGPDDTDIPLPGIGEHRLSPNGGSFTLETPNGRHAIGRGRPYRIGRYALYLTGPATGTVLTVFAGAPERQPPGYYDYDPSLVFTGPLIRSESPRKSRILTGEGFEVEANEVGTFIVPLGGRTELRVLRIPVPGSDESDLEIFFQDKTNDHGTYPAGRFVSLVPTRDGNFRLDFNRSRNPFCAYSSAYPCPLPWRGNLIADSVRAGERYTGGGLESIPAAENGK